MTPNIVASVRAKLQNLAKARNAPFQEVLQYYGMERFLFRLAKSDHKEKFALKGALMLKVWEVAEARSTKDIDFLGQTSNQRDNIEKLFAEICDTEVEQDGLLFDKKTITTEEISEVAEYTGIRVTFMGFLEKARIPMQVDIGFSDEVYPEMKEIAYPSLLGMPEPKLRGYPMESVIAEKTEAITKLGLANSRLKDYYDIWVLSRLFEFQFVELNRAITTTFENRKTTLTQSPEGLSENFYKDEKKLEQWEAFRKRNHSLNCPNLDVVVRHNAQFINPLIDSNNEHVHPTKWSPENGWS